jgi:hypothetical protein
LTLAKKGRCPSRYSCVSPLSRLWAIAATLYISSVPQKSRAHLQAARQLGCPWPWHLHLRFVRSSRQLLSCSVRQAASNAPCTHELSDSRSVALRSCVACGWPTGGPSVIRDVGQGGFARPHSKAAAPSCLGVMLCMIPKVSQATQRITYSWPSEARPVHEPRSCPNHRAKHTLRSRLIQDGRQTDPEKCSPYCGLRHQRARGLPSPEGKPDRDPKGPSIRCKVECGTIQCSA